MTTTARGKVNARRAARGPVPAAGAAVGSRVEGAGWRAVELVVSYPIGAGLVAGAVTATTPVTLGELAGVVVGVCAAVGVAGLSGSRRGRLESVTATAKYRKRARRIRRRWVTAMTDAGLVKAPVFGGPARRVPRLVGVERIPLGVAAYADAARVSAGAADMRAKADKFRHAFGAAAVRFTDTTDRRGRHRVRLDVHYEDPFTNIIRVSSLPTATRPLYATIGLDEDGRPVEKDLRLPNLIVGAQGSGKSTELWTLLHALQAAGVPHRVRVFDPKGGQEFVELDGAAYDYERDPTAWPTFLGRAHRALDGRQKALRAGRLRRNTFTDTFPLDVMVVDELLTALAFGTGSAKVRVGSRQIKASDAFMVYLSTARSAGFTVLALSQLAQAEVLGPIRGLFGYATCLRVGPTEDSMVNVILGAGAAKAYPAHELPADERHAGIGYMATVRGVVKYRAAMLTDAERAKVAARMAADTTRLRALVGDQDQDHDDQEGTE